MKLFPICLALALFAPARGASNSKALNQALLDSLQRTNEAVTLHILAQGADPNARDAQGETALMHAADDGLKEIAALLIKHGAAVNAHDSRGRTALGAAAQRGDLDLVKLLLDHKANPKLGSPLVCALMAEKDQPDIVRLLIRRGADVNARENQPGEKDTKPGNRIMYGIEHPTPLGEALESRKQESAKILINAGANVNATGDLGAGILVDAAMSEVWTDDLTMVSMLLDHGAKPNGKGGYSQPLILAARNGNPKVMRALLNHGANAETKDSQGNTPLMALASYGGHERSLIAQMGYAHPESDKVFHPTKAELAKILEDTKTQDAECVQELVAKGADPNAKTKSGETALSLAAKAGNASAITALIAAGADADLAGAEGLTPLMWAAQAGQTDAARALLDAKVEINAKSPNGATALQIATEAGKTETADVITAAGGTIPPATPSVVTPQTLFTVTELPMTDAVGINDQGDVAGTVAPDRNAAGLNSVTEAVLWRDGKVFDLGPGEVLALMTDGRVVVRPGATIVHGQFVEPPPPFIWDNGSRSPVKAELDNGTIFSPGGVMAWSHDKNLFVTLNDKTTILEVPKGMTPSLNAVNDLGGVIGTVDGTPPVYSSKITARKKWPATPPNTLRRVLWVNGKIAGRWNLGAFHPYVLNNRNVAAGSTGPEIGSHAALWSNGKITILPHPAGLTSDEAVALNDAGDAVGETIAPPKMDLHDYRDSFRAVLWRNGHAILLDDAIPQDTGWVIQSADAINNRGEIVCAARRNGVQHTVLLRTISDSAKGIQ